MFSCSLAIFAAGLCKASRPWQCAAATARTRASGDKIVAKIAEVVSGCLPTEQRQKLLSLITSQKFDKIYVESSRAIARTATAAEQIYDIAREHNVQIIPSDMPTLYAHTPDAMHKFLRKIIFAVTELDRDMTVGKLQDGIRRKLKSTPRRTQKGRPKVTGRKSILEKLMPSRIVLQRLRQLATKHMKDSNYGLRSVAVDMRKILGLTKDISHETARRLLQSVARRLTNVVACPFLQRSPPCHCLRCSLT